MGAKGAHLHLHAMQFHMLRMFSSFSYSVLGGITLQRETKNARAVFDHYFAGNCIKIVISPKIFIEIKYPIC